MAFYSADPINMESVSAVTATNTVEPGTRRTVGNAKYVYVYNNGTTQISVGKAAIVTALSGYSVTVSSLSGGFAVGFCKHATLTTATYGWLLTQGFVDGVTNAMASTALTAGDSIQLGVDGGVCKGETGPYLGKHLNGTASAGTGNAYICIF
jgi:hypothetical protein